VPGQHHQTAEQTTHEQVDNWNHHSAMIPTAKFAQARPSNRAPQRPYRRDSRFGGAAS
jgi:hypothetical protein